MKKLIVIVVVLIALPNICVADIYHWIADNGVKTWSDTPRTYKDKAYSQSSEGVLDADGLTDAQRKRAQTAGRIQAKMEMECDAKYAEFSYQHDGCMANAKKTVSYLY